MTFYLYGHYDSRGGAWLIESPTREAADAKYCEAFCCEGFTDYEGKEYSKAQQEADLVAEDFISEVTFSSYREVQDGEDLEQGYAEPPDGEAWKLARAFEDGLAWAEDEVVKRTPNPFVEWLWVRRDDEGTPVELKLCEAGKHPVEAPKTAEWPHQFDAAKWKQLMEPWTRSDLGEDACGVVMTKLGA